MSGFVEDQTPESRHAKDETPPTAFEPDGHCRLQTLPGTAVKQLPDTNTAPFSVALMAGQPWDPYLAPTWSTAVCISLSVRAPEKRATSYMLPVNLLVTPLSSAPRFNHERLPCTEMGAYEKRVCEELIPVALLLSQETELAVLDVRNLDGIQRETL